MNKCSIIAVACPDQGEGTDLKALGLAFHHQGPTFIGAYCQAATNQVDQDRGRGNHLPQPRRSGIS